MYKYSEEIHSKSLLNMGCIRIGTLQNYRDSEHKRGIADPKEGKKLVYHHIDDALINLNDPNDRNNQIAKSFGAMGGKAKVHCKGVLFGKDIESPDCYILCMSNKLSQSVMSELDEADTCVEIVNHTLFFDQLTLAISDITPVNFIGVYEVTYQNKQEVWNGNNWGRNAALIKDLEFKEQYEIRAIWVPQNNIQIKPIILGSAELGLACKLSKL
ncbi:hypothetical protein [Psychromonas aquimarina]|uniref:hypothetical protein n=1 Tax=Psychromonas aquimarina TaxID=444919 RepID=UPI00041F381E|nr:hypothetical protein [Psychromonas aquimarina]